jgi:hypothetical protein
MTGLTSKVSGLFADSAGDGTDGTSNGGDVTSNGKDVNKTSNNDGNANNSSNVNGNSNNSGVSSDDSDGSSDRQKSGRGGMRLKVIGQPQLLKQAQNLFTLAIGEENDDHSRYPEFLMDLDGLLRKYGAESNLARDNSDMNAGDDENSSDMDDQDNWK